MKKQKWLGALIFLLAISIVMADDGYKPYLHNPTIPESPNPKLYGAYSTSLFPGAATYSYELEVPPGTNNLQPSLTISYNSQSVKQRPSVLGAGWTLPQNYIQRHVNFTPSNSSDDYFILVLNGASYDLIYDLQNERYHTETETFARVQIINDTNNEFDQYWFVTLKDGTALRFGYNLDSELVSEHNHSLKWSLDQIQDLFGNTISYSYAEDPFPDDVGTTYLKSITYNNDQKRKIEFDYEKQNRPHRRLVYEQGIASEETRRLENVFVLFNDSLVRRYNFNYFSFEDTFLSSLSSIAYFGNDNSSMLHNVSFEFYEPSIDYVNSTSYDLDNIVGSGGEDNGYRFVDLNNDGLIDYLRGAQGGSIKYARLNDGSSWVNTTDFTPPEYFVTGAYADRGVRVADINTDGFPDIIMGYGSVRKAWLNTGSGFENATLTWAPPFDFQSATADFGVRLIDINGDGRVDIVRAVREEFKQIFLNTGSGWRNVTPFLLPPDHFVTANPTYADYGLRAVDLNGDGLIDFMQGYSSFRQAWLNTGTGYINVTDKWKPPKEFTGSGQDKGVRFIDLNGDGLVDIVQDFFNSSQQISQAWLNNGSGWVQNDDWRSPEIFTNEGKNKGIRIGDVNGDGAGDIIVGKQSGSRYVTLRVFNTPYLLKNITNEFGGVTSISYNQSTLNNNTGEDGLSDIGFNIWTVSKVEQDNALTGAFSSIGNTTYAYESGFYDYNDSEFRGFGLVNETLSDSSIVSHYFHQSKPLKGKEFKSEVYDSSSNLFSRTENKYNVSEVNNSFGTYFIVQLSHSSSYQYDGSEIPDVINTTYAYDSYSNVVEKTSLGFVDVSGDEKYERYEFVYNNSAWILDKVKKYQLFDSNNQTKIRETKYFYDNSLDSVSRGALTKKEDYLDDGTGNPVTYYLYDDFGNPYRQTDPLGNTIVYYYGTQDSTNTFPDRRVNELGHAVDYIYEIATGNILSETKNGITTSNEYDIFGRISKEIQTYDSSTYPTKKYSYDFDGIAPEFIKVSQKTNSNNTLDTYYFYDGFANLVQIKTPSEDSQQVVKNIFYDGLFRVSEEQNPYFDGFSEGIASVSESEPTTQYQYDALSRITQVTNPDSTTKVTLYHKNIIKDYDENENYKTYYLDSYDRIIAVEEHNEDFYIGDNETYNTTYSYNGADELVSIRDNYGNNFNFTYNSLGQKIQLDDPDLGLWSYSYDFAGNLISQIDNIGNQIGIGYDGLNRITHKNTSNSEITFSYDEEYQGTLSSIKFDNFTLSYDYDDRLRAIKETLLEGNVSVGTTSYESSFSFDSADRLLSIELPNEEDLDYYYDSMSRITEILGYVNSTSYNPFGNPLNRSYFNEKATTFVYDPQNARLQQIKTDSDQELNYSYDSVGNIVSIDDTANSRNYRMSYDNLDRLTNVSINDYNWVYNYDALGNILRIVRNFSTTTSFKIGDIPHAPSRVIEINSGVDLLREFEANSTSKTRIVQFYLVNEKNETLTGANWSAEFEPGNKVDASVPFNLAKNENALVILEHTYASGGTYGVNLTGRAQNSITDTEALDIVFGALAQGLDVLEQNTTLIVAGFSAENSLSEDSLNWEWECNNGAVSTIPFNMSANEEVFIVIQHNYSLENSSISCLVRSDDGNQSALVPISFDGVYVEGYNSTLQGDSGIEVQFVIKNYFDMQDVSWNITVDGQVASSSSPVSLDQGESVTVIQGFNFTDRGVKPLTITVYSSDFVDTYSENIRLYSLDIKDFLNIVKDETTRILNFVISNTWTDLTAYWNVSDPLVSNTVNLSQNESLFVIIEEDYSQGQKQVVVELYNQTKREDMITEVFVIKHIEIEDLETVGGDKSSVMTALVVNNVDKRNVSWQLDTSSGVISSTQDLELDTSEFAFVIVGESYADSGVYPLNFRINSSNLNDNESGVAIT